MWPEFTLAVFFELEKVVARAQKKSNREFGRLIYLLMVDYPAGSILYILLSLLSHVIDDDLKVQQSALSSFRLAQNADSKMKREIEQKGS